MFECQCQSVCVNVVIIQPAYFSARRYGTFLLRYLLRIGGVFLKTWHQEPNMASKTR